MQIYSQAHHKKGKSSPVILQKLTGIVSQSHQRLLHLPLKLFINVLRILQVTPPVLIDGEVAHTHFQHTCKCHWVRTSGNRWGNFDL